MNPKNILEKLIFKENLSFEESQNIMKSLMRGEFTNIQIAGILTALRMKGETSEEIAGLSQSMQELSFPIKQAPEAIDVVGTGGAKFKTFNVSSMTGLVLSSMGIKVAKHGNRSNSSKCGSADFLEGLGVNLRLDPESAYNLYNQYNFVYLFAPFYHRSMKHAITARKELQVRTIFNVLGPLTNPMGVKKSLIGVFDDNLLKIIAESLSKRGHERVAVVYNRNGADEILNNGVTDIVELKNSELLQYELSSEDFGLSSVPLVDLVNRDVEQSVYDAKQIILGNESSLSEFVAINAAMAMRIYGSGENLVSNTSKVLDHMYSGKMINHIQGLVQMSGGRISIELNAS